MYIWLFSRSDGAGSATTRKTRGLTRSVIALIVPPLPAASRPSKTMTTRRPFAFTHSWSAHSLPCSRAKCFSYFFRVIGGSPGHTSSRLPPAAERTIELGARPQFRAAGLCEEELFLEEILVGGQDLDVTGEARVVARA